MSLLSKRHVSIVGSLNSIVILHRKECQITQSVTNHEGPVGNGGSVNGEGVQGVGEGVDRVDKWYRGWVD